MAVIQADDIQAPPSDQTAKPPTPTATPPSWRNTAQKAAKNIVAELPTAGMVIGGALGTPADVVSGPMGTAVGAGIGAGAGEAVRQTLTHWFPDLGDAPKGTADALENTTRQIAFGVGGEAVGQGINKLFEVAAPYVAKAAPYVAKAAKAVYAVPDAALDAVSGKLKSSASKNLQAVMRPSTSHSVTEAESAAKGLLEGPASNYLSLTRKGLESKAAARGKQVGAAIESAEAPISKEPVKAELVTELNKSLNEYVKKFFPYSVNPDLPGFDTDAQRNELGKLAEHYKGITSASDAEIPGSEVTNPDTGEVRIDTQLVKGVDRGDLRKLKQFVDKSIERSHGFQIAAVSRENPLAPNLQAKMEVDKVAADMFRKTLNEDRPDISKLNAEFHLTQQIRAAMAPFTQQEKLQKFSTPWAQLWHAKATAWMIGLGSAAGAGAGHSLGNAAISETALATGALFATAKLMQSAAWNTASAAAKNQLADLLAKGEYESVAKLATQIAAGTVAAAPTAAKVAATDTARKTVRPPSVANKTIKMRAPNGQTQDVPAEQADHYKSLGAQVVQ